MKPDINNCDDNFINYDFCWCVLIVALEKILPDTGIKTEISAIVLSLPFILFCRFFLCVHFILSNELDAQCVFFFIIIISRWLRLPLPVTVNVS